MTAAIPHEAHQEADVVRKIIHVDMDAFYASVEQRDNPNLQGQAIIVGDPRGWGIVATASYEARALGVRAGMPVAAAKRDHPDLTVVAPRLDVYQKTSRAIHRIFSDYTTLIEPVFLDEAYLDVTDTAGTTPATVIAQTIRKRILDEVGVNASAGVSYNKFLAKLACDQIKPNGLSVVKPGQGAGFVEHLPVKLFQGIGPATTAKLHELRIQTGGELRALSLDVLVKHFGKHGRHFFDLARGVDHRPVQVAQEHQSHSLERSFKDQMSTLAQLDAALAPIVEGVWHKCEVQQVRGRTVTLRLRFAEFSQITRSRTSDEHFTSKDDLEQFCRDLMASVVPEQFIVRRLGVTVSALAPVKGKDANRPFPQQLRLLP